MKYMDRIRISDTLPYNYTIFTTEVEIKIGESVYTYDTYVIEQLTTENRLQITATGWKDLHP